MSTQDVGAFSFRALASAKRSIGLILPTLPQGPDPNWDIHTIANQAEALGADALWVCDHLAWHSPVLECFSALSLAAHGTSKCCIGAGVLQLPLRPTPLVAKSSSSIALISGGRFILGVGVGVHNGEYDALDVGFHERGKRTELAIGQLREIWNHGGLIEGETRYLQKPIMGGIPIWVGGSSPRVRSRAARLGDGWMPLFVPPETIGQEIAKLRDEAAQHSRNANEIVTSIVLFVSTDKNSGENSLATRGLEWMGSLYNLAGSKFAKHLVCGSPEQCVDLFEQYYLQGVQHIVVFVTDDNPLEQFSLIQDELRSRRTTASPERESGLESTIENAKGH